MQATMEEAFVFRWGIRNGQPIERTDDYVEYIEEILELDTAINVQLSWCAIGLNVQQIHAIQVSKGIHMDSV